MINTCAVDYTTKYEIFRSTSSQLGSRLDSWWSIVQPRCSESFAEWVTLEDCVRAFWVQETLALKHLVYPISSNKRFCTVLITWLALKISVHMLMLLERSWTIFWDAIVGRRAISLYFHMLLSPWDDDVACVTTNVDHVAEVAVGVVVVVALLFLLAVGDALVPERPFWLSRQRRS